MVDVFKEPMFAVELDDFIHHVVLSVVVSDDVFEIAGSIEDHGVDTGDGSCRELALLRLLVCYRVFIERVFFSCGHLSIGSCIASVGIPLFFCLFFLLILQISSVIRL